LRGFTRVELLPGVPPAAEDVLTCADVDDPDALERDAEDLDAADVFDAPEDGAVLATAGPEETVSATVLSGPTGELGPGRVATTVPRTASFVAVSARVLSPARCNCVVASSTGRK
jgi:hypothetical protein